MADFTSAGAAGRSGFANGIGRHVVLVHIAFGCYAVNAVEFLGFGNKAEGCNGKNLGLSAGEHTAAVGSGKKANFCGKRTDFIKTTSVNTFAVVDEPTSYNVFLKFVDSFVDFENIVGINFVKFFMNSSNDGLESSVTNVFVIGVKSSSNIFDCKFFDFLEHFCRNINYLIFKFGFADFCNNAVDEIYHLNVFFVSGHDCFEHGGVINFVCACFDHNNLFVGGRNDKVKVGFCILFSGGVKDDFAVNKADFASCDRSVPRNVGNCNSHGSADHSAHAVRIIGVNGHCGHNYRAVVSHILGEKRTHRAVDYAAVKNSSVGGAAFSSGEGAGDFTYGIKLFVKIDGKREIVNAFAGCFACGNVAKNSGFAVSYKNRSICKAAHFAGFKADFASAVFGFKNSVIFEHKKIPPF